MKMNEQTPIQLEVRNLALWIKTADQIDLICLQSTFQMLNVPNNFLDREVGKEVAIRMAKDEKLRRAMLE